MKKLALYNWQLCDDGRLYHHVVAEFVKDAWHRKEANRHRTEAATNARKQSPSRQRNDQRNVNVTVPSPSGLPLPDRERDRDQVPSLKNKPTSARARANGRAREGDKINENAPLGRSAPLGGVKAKRKELLQDKLLRFARATMSSTASFEATLGLMGDDTEHSAQWWLDHLDQSMRAARWDDTHETAT